ncbi:MAG TPA: XdhC/CoxI family protein [Candidatus Dormibacteraeota bacterium]|nr:XdhC/CoxI family protein [Candidatus Dormibacteraeota bacterium]
MRDFFAVVARWSRERTPFALATLVDVRNAAPAPLGASMAATADCTVAGDIGAGCYEGEIVEAAMETARDGKSRVLSIDLSSDDPLTGGTGCGGFLEVVTWRPPAGFDVVAGAIVAGRTDVTFPIAYEREGSMREFVMHVPARRTLIVVGGTTLAKEVASFAARLEYRTVVVDPRPAFATPERLAGVDEIIVDWPQDVLAAMLSATTPLLVISHDPKIDLPALRAGLASEAPYIGLLGSHRAQEGRRAALRADGFGEAALARIHGPAGLDIGGVTMAETAVSIVAEIVAVARERGGGPLLRHGGSIHNLAR